jgi:hypothetical protein
LAPGTNFGWSNCINHIQPANKKTRRPKAKAGFRTTAALAGFVRRPQAEIKSAQISLYAPAAPRSSQAQNRRPLALISASN